MSGEFVILKDWFLGTPAGGEMERPAEIAQNVFFVNRPES